MGGARWKRSSDWALLTPPGKWRCELDTNPLGVRGTRIHAHEAALSVCDWFSQFPAASGVGAAAEVELMRRRSSSACCSPTTAVPTFSRRWWARYARLRSARCSLPSCRVWSYMRHCRGLSPQPALPVRISPWFRLQLASIVAYTVPVQSPYSRLCRRRHVG